MEKRLKIKDMKLERTFRDKDKIYKRNLMKKNKNFKIIL